MLKSILITGGGSGIGAALAKAMAERGCDVVISGRRRSALEDIAARSQNISICAGDVTDAVHRGAWRAALADLPAPRGVFHGAGYFQTGRLDDLCTADWQRSFDTNVTARWQLTRALGPLLNGGRVLFIGSDAGANPRAGAAAYSIAQAASETLRRALQAEWAARDVAIAGFKPGLVDTGMVRGFLALSEEEFPARAAYQAYLEKGEVARPATVAMFARWLLLDVDAERLAATEWDIRDTAHHCDWLDGPLYPRTGSDT